MTTRYIAIIVETATSIDLERLHGYPGVEVYEVTTEDEIDMALLNDLHCPVNLVFVGGGKAKRFADLYGGIWISDTPSVNDDLIRVWGL